MEQLWRIPGINKPLTAKAKYFFKTTFKIVDYDVVPASITKRVLILDEVPGKIFQWLRFKTKRRIFVKTLSSQWSEVANQTEINCDKKLSDLLNKVSSQLETKYKLRLKARRIKYEHSH